MGLSSQVISESRAVIAGFFNLEVHTALRKNGDSYRKNMVQLYTAAFATHFTDILGKTYPWLKTKEAQKTVLENLRCEQEEDHVQMLLCFADSCGALPDKHHYAYVAQHQTQIRQLLTDTRTAGLSGLTILTVLENTSSIFIPRLQRAARKLGSKNLVYTRKHGVADVEHSRALKKALAEEEKAEGYRYPGVIISQAQGAAQELVKAAFSPAFLDACPLGLKTV